ncbi:MAG: hypothetical protein ACKO35_07020 [Planctomycetaceae bacterium]
MRASRSERPTTLVGAVIAIVMPVGLAAAMDAEPPAAPARPPGLDIEWVVVGDPGNPPDTTGHGAVADAFAISRHEITVGQYATFLSAVAARDPHGLWQGAQGIVREGEAGAYRYSPPRAASVTRSCTSASSMRCGSRTGCTTWMARCMVPRPSRRRS